MSSTARHVLIVLLSAALLAALFVVQVREVDEQRQRAGLAATPISPPERSRRCVECHQEDQPGLVRSWRAGGHAAAGIGCVECHRARPEDADGYEHYDERIATVVTPRDCGRCHEAEAHQYARSRHAQAAITAERGEAQMHAARAAAQAVWTSVPGAAAKLPGGAAPPPWLGTATCAPCHGSTVGLVAVGGAVVTAAELGDGATGARPELTRSSGGVVELDLAGWPNTGVGRRNLDGSLGSCSACHGRHDFSRARARQPASCGRCHQGSDQPELEIFLASKHQAAAATSVGGATSPDGSDGGASALTAPTCATCHLSGRLDTGQPVTHDPGVRLGWAHRGPLAVRRDTDPDGRWLPADRPVGAAADGWQDKRQRMSQVCEACHAAATVRHHFARYDGFVAELDGRGLGPAAVLMAALAAGGLRTAAPFDEPIEWTWYALWHQHGRRARLATAMLSPDDAQAGGIAPLGRRMAEELLPQAWGLVRQARDRGDDAAAARLEALLGAAPTTP